jgi:hypothetical protein
MKALYLDDVRVPTQTLEGYEPWAVVRNYDEFVRWIQANGMPDYISFDHDLADEHMQDYYKNQARGNHSIEYQTFKEKTGVDCLMHLIDIAHARESHRQKPLFPSHISVHSANPVGARNIHSLASNFVKHMCFSTTVSYTIHPFVIETRIEDE